MIDVQKASLFWAFVASLAYLIESFLDDGFALCIQSRRGFIQEKDLRISNESSGDGDNVVSDPRSVVLPSRQPLSHISANQNK